MKNIIIVIITAIKKILLYPKKCQCHNGHRMAKLIFHIAENHRGMTNKFSIPPLTGSCAGE